MGSNISKSIYVASETGELVKKTVIVKYNMDEDEFWVKVPAHLVGEVNGWSKSGDGPWEPSEKEPQSGLSARSPAELFKVIEAASAAYVKALTKRVKVIGYGVEYGIGRQVNIDLPGSTGHSYNHDGTKLALSWEISYKIDVGGKTRFARHENGSGYVRDPDAWVPWTAERERFFQDTENALALLALRFNKFFEHKDLAAVLDARPKQLLLSAEKK